MNYPDTSERLWIFESLLSAVVSSLPKTTTGIQTASRLLETCLSFAPRFDACKVALSRAEWIDQITTTLAEIRATRRSLLQLRQDRLLPVDRIEPLVYESTQLSRVLERTRQQAIKARTALPIARTIHQEDLSESLWILEEKIGKIASALPGSSSGQQFLLQLMQDDWGFASRYDEVGTAKSHADAMQRLALTLRSLQNIRGRLGDFRNAGLVPLDSLNDVIRDLDQVYPTLAQCRRRFKTVGSSSSTTLSRRARILQHI